MLLIELDRSSAVPAYLQIRDRIAALVDDGALRPGDRVPPSRGLAVSVGVHRTTVVRAYDELRALGYLDSRPGSYTTIRRRARPPATADRARSVPGSGLIEWRSPGSSSRPGDRPSAAPAANGDPVDFERLAADPSLAPTADLRRCLRAALGADAPASVDYAAPAGWLPLRQTLSRRLRAHGVAVSSDEIVVTHGAQQALDLVLRLLTRPGDRVAMEAPTYGMLHPLLRLHGVESVEVPIREDGLDLDALAALLEQSRVRFVYTMPNFHNPTGITTDQAHRERLLALCEASRTPLVEDGFEEEMKYLGRAVLPIKSMDAHGVVLYVGTLSKVVFPGLRLGWIAAPIDAARRLEEIQHATCLAANTLTQAAADRFIRSGDLELYLRRVHRIYRRRMAALLDGLERHLPAGISWTRPIGGYTLWLTLPHPVADEPALVHELASAGVLVAPGCWYYAAPPPTAHLRLSIACVDEGRIDDGCRRLGEVLRMSAYRAGRLDEL